MLYPFTLTNISYNHQVLELGSGMGKPAPGPRPEACPAFLPIPGFSYTHTCKCLGPPA